MHTKIASIILNSAKAAGLSDVYVSQPDAAKENSAGKIFLLAEIAGKKAEGRKIFDFLILALTDNYYNDEKILFRDRIEGLKLENIFEAAITKTNKDLASFLHDEKIRLNPETTNLTLGVIYENKIHFSNFGRNRALLIYRQNSGYSLINVEANAQDEELEEELPEGVTKAPQLFSSVISGEIPAASYFVIASESLPEYLSSQDLISIVTELPPMTAAQQIKNTLGQINTYVPFLGIIVKNTVGLPQAEKYESLPDNLSARNSISALNHTEQKTEQMLAPAGMINFSQLLKKSQELIAKWLIPPVPSGRSVRYRTARAPQEKAAPEEGEVSPQPSVELGRVSSARQAGRDSFLIKEKIFFKKKSSYLVGQLKKIWLGLLNVINPGRWPLALTRARTWFLKLNLRNRWLFVALGLFLVVLTANMFYISARREQAALRQKYEEALATLESKETQIDFYLLYNNQEGASRALLEAQTAIDALPITADSGQEEYQQLSDRLKSSEDKVEKVTRLTDLPQAYDLSGKNINALVALAGKLYASSGDTIYELAAGTISDGFKVPDSGQLSRPALYGESLAGYFNQDRLIEFNPAQKTTKVRRFNEADALNEVNASKVYNNNFYALNKTAQQILRFSSSGGNFAAPTNWLKETADLSQASDLAIDGKIYVLQANGQVLKFNLGKSESYESKSLVPAINDATRLIAGGQKLYFISPSKKRLVVLDKENGRLSRQYLLENISSIADYAVDEAAQKAFILSNGLVYELNLK